MLRIAPGRGTGVVCLALQTHDRLSCVLHADLPVRSSAAFIQPSHDSRGFGQVVPLTDAGRLETIGYAVGHSLRPLTPHDTILS